MANVVTRIGAIIRTLVSLGLETLAIGTEAAKLFAEHLDAFIDDLGKDAKSSNPSGAVTDRLGEVARSLSATALSTAGVFTETLKLATLHLDGFLDDLNQRVTIKPTP